MKITPLKVLLFVVSLGFLIVLRFIGLLVYESKKDISDQAPYINFLNKPLEVKNVSTIRWNKNNFRFRHYALVVNEASNFNTDEVKSVKQYQPGDYITFHAAKSYYSIHVDETYYLIARDTLDSGEVIEFEYYYTPNQTPFQ